jgi:hypothetical protein
MDPIEGRLLVVLWSLLRPLFEKQDLKQLLTLERLPDCVASPFEVLEYCLTAVWNLNQVYHSEAPAQGVRHWAFRLLEIPRDLVIDIAFCSSISIALAHFLVDVHKSSDFGMVL